MTDLPKLDCGGCRKCCQGGTIFLSPQDDVTRYKTKLVDGQRVLAKGSDGNCVYLGKRGCQIHGEQPQMCRAFDCRAYFLSKENNGLLVTLQHPLKRHVVMEGRRRVLALRRAAMPAPDAPPETAARGS